jgi:choline dehydrogenase-like flavoprotein
MMKSEFDVVVVGSGAGGGVVAGELAVRGRDVLLLELGSHYTAASFTRWESRAAMELMWPLRFAFAADGDVIAFLAGRCVGGTTTINTKVALRAHERDVAKWHPASGLTSDGATPFVAADLAPYYEQVERLLGVRERTDWSPCVHTVEPAFRELGAPLEAVTAYTDSNCSKCGSCIQGCPTNAGKSTMNTYISEALARGLLELRADSAVDRVLVEHGEAVGVEYVDADGVRHTVRAGAVVVACGALNTPQLLLRSGLTNPAIGRNLGLHPVRLVYGLFDEVQDAHMVYPITAHSMAHQHDEDGGFVIEATTVQDPIGFATTLGDERGPLWGRPLVEAVRRYRHWNGVLAMVNDENTCAVVVDEDGGERFDVAWNENERRRLDAALAFSREVLERAGAREICWSGIASTHVQGSCRMGDDPTASVVDRNGETHEVRRLFVGDASLIPRTLSVNPSLTIMALATRLAEHLDADIGGYLSAKAARTAA